MSPADRTVVNPRSCLPQTHTTLQSVTAHKLTTPLLTRRDSLTTSRCILERSRKQSMLPCDSCPFRAQQETLSAFRVHSFSPQREGCACSRAAFIPDSTSLGSTRVLWHLNDPRRVVPPLFFLNAISEKLGPGLPLAAIFCPVALIPPSFSSTNWEPACCSYHRPQPTSKSSGLALPLDWRQRVGSPRPLHNTHLGTSARPPPALGPCTPSSSPWAPPQEAVASRPGLWRGSGGVTPAVGPP